MAWNPRRIGHRRGVCFAPKLANLYQQCMVRLERDGFILRRASALKNL